MTLDFDSTNHIDLRSLQLDLRVSLNSDGGNRPVGVCRYTTIAARARNQDIDQTENSHISICTHPESKTKQLRLLIPLRNNCRIRITGLPLDALLVRKM